MRLRWVVAFLIPEFPIHTTLEKSFPTSSSAQSLGLPRRNCLGSFLTALYLAFFPSVVHRPYDIIGRYRVWSSSEWIEIPAPSLQCTGYILYLTSPCLGFLRYYFPKGNKDYLLGLLWRIVNLCKGLGLLLQSLPSETTPFPPTTMRFWWKIFFLT